MTSITSKGSRNRFGHERRGTQGVHGGTGDVI